jgi:hypothetical protein
MARLFSPLHINTHKNSSVFCKKFSNKCLIFWIIQVKLPKVCTEPANPTEESVKNTNIMPVSTEYTAKRQQNQLEIFFSYFFIDFIQNLFLLQNFLGIKNRRDRERASGGPHETAGTEWRQERGHSGQEWQNNNRAETKLIK